MAHDNETARKRCHHPQVVRDEQVGEIEPLLQVAQQIDDLCLDQHVERACRLVEHDEGRLEHNRARDCDALALPTGELMRIAEPCRRVEPDITQRTDHLLLALFVGEIRKMDPQPLLDDVGNRHARAERPIGVLEHDLHIAAERPHRFEVQASQRLAQERDQALRGNEPQDRKPERRLAGP